jgi:hypothetical protein
MMRYSIDDGRKKNDMMTVKTVFYVYARINQRSFQQKTKKGSGK